MHDAIQSMLTRYKCQSQEDYVNALREILQELALLGLWRAKFFEHAAFYGGTALRVLYGLDRYSEDLDFSLLAPDPSFSLQGFGEALAREIQSFGFEVAFESRQKTKESAIESAFLKTNTYRQLVLIEVDQAALRGVHPSKTLKIRLEVDIDPPGGFRTQTHFVLQPIPFSVRVFCLPDLFAGKLHAVLCRKWKTRVKGRDWYDLVWYAGRYPHFRIHHLEARMRQTGDYTDDRPLDAARLNGLLCQAVENLDVTSACREVAPFVVDRRALDLWSKPFLNQIITRIIPI